LGISWRAAWRLKHKPLRAMLEQEADRVLRGRVEVDTLMVSGGLAGFLAAGAQVTYHQRVVVHPRKSSELDCFHWINTLPGNLKNSIRGTCHGFKVRKYAARYLAEAQYRFNRRFDLPSLVPRLLFACVHTPPCTEKQLKAAELWT
ncbi:transposase, partial [Thiolapillus sp.]|uniref:transposase n=1 Tax=Thiolapillus sp. TaxID=2017437 RepID=UPI003AF753D9